MAESHAELSATAVVPLPDGNARGAATPPLPQTPLGAAPFTLTARIHTDGTLGSELGDIASQFDADTRTGFSFGLQTQVWGLVLSQVFMFRVAGGAGGWDLWVLSNIHSPLFVDAAS